MQTPDQGQPGEDDLGPADRTHGLTLQRIDDGYEPLHGEGHHEPHRAEAGQVAEEGEELAEVVPVIDVHVEEVQPLGEESGQEAGVAHGQGGQVEAGREFSQLCLEEDKHGEDVADAAGAAQNGNIVLMDNVPDEKGDAQHLLILAARRVLRIHFGDIITRGGGPVAVRGISISERWSGCCC